MRQFIVILLILLSIPILSAQKTTVFTDVHLEYKRGLDFFEKGLYGQSREAFQKFLDLARPLNEAPFEDLQMNAELYMAKSAVRLQLPDGEKQIIDFVRNYSPDPLASKAIIEAGNYYYNSKDYEKAFTFYSMIDHSSLSTEEKSEVLFKKGYALFVRKNFKQAKSLFVQIKEYKNQYYYPTNYYLGMTEFFEGNYDNAIESFQKIKTSNKYKNYIPYYIGQIYFSEQQYDKLLEYALPILDNKSVKNRKELSRLVGQTYFEKGMYEDALPYLEFAAKKSNKMSEEDFYQLGYTQYKTNNYKTAIKNLFELSKLDSPLGQNALYTMADAYLKISNKPSARNAFAAASRMKYNEQIQKEALWNYAKLSYELKYDTEAINALQGIGIQSPYYNEAQSIMSNIFLNTRNYEQAMTTIERIPEKTPKLREAYQKVAYFRGVQMYKDNKLGQAKTLFLKSLEVPVDKRTKALANYWLGNISHNNKDYDGSIKRVNQFLLGANGVNNLPDESSVHTGNYMMGYNYLKQKKYENALKYFRDAITGIKQNSQFIEDPFVKKQILGDALMRCGDCYFKANNYDEAVKYYNEAINSKHAGYEYAIYQKAIIEGLRGNNVDKILALEQLIAEFPQSEYTDDALFQLGNTYQDLGKFNDAVKPLSRLVTNYPNSSVYNQALLKLGLITYNQGDYDQAIKYYKDVFNHNPDETEALAALKALEEIYVEDLGQPNEFFKFKESIPGYEVGNEERESISYKAAETQFENANYERAINGYREYLQSYPNGRYSLQANYNMAESYAVLQNYSEALRFYEKTFEKGPSKYYEKALNKAALIAYNHSNDFNKSYSYFKKLEEVAKTDDLRFDAQIGALRSAYLINNIDAIIETSSKVINNPLASDEQKANANFYIGKIAFDRKDYDKAIAAFNQVIRNSDTELTAEARYLMAYIYYDRRELDTAKQICINANKESSSYPVWVAKSILLLADILTEQNDLFNARAALEAIIENFTQDPTIVQQAKEKLIKVNAAIDKDSRLSTDPADGNLDMIEEEGQ